MAKAVTTKAKAKASPSKEELYEEAKSLDIEGRSEMDEDQLEAAIAKARASGPAVQAGEARTMHPDDDLALGKTNEKIERSWSRGADLEDTAAIEAANKNARLGNTGSTGGTVLQPTAPATP